MPLCAENDFLPDLDSIPADIRRRAKLLVINYPNSPTGKVATREFYARVVDFAVKNEVVVVQDAAHVMLSYGDRPLSFLEVPGAREVGVEIHSLSKGWNMIGWRMGWVCGHERIVRALADVKDNSDSGQFIAIQKAAAAALDDPSIPRQPGRNMAAACASWWPRSATAASTAACPAAHISSIRPVPRAWRAASALRRRRPPPSS